MFASLEAWHRLGGGRRFSQPHPQQLPAALLPEDDALNLPKAHFLPRGKNSHLESIKGQRRGEQPWGASVSCRWAWGG